MPEPLRVAAVVTVYHRHSHADVILRNVFDGYPPEYATRPNFEIVSMYVDQMPAGPRPDLSRDLAAKHGFRIYDAIADALTLGGKALAVDGVLSIGEHGDYPDNKLRQTLYPRRRFFQAIAAVFEASGRSVPVFNDKHLSAKWDDAQWVYDRARKLLVPLMAGSSVPLTWRKPDLQLPMGCEITGAVQLGYGHVEHYGYHAIEALQCMVERRRIEAAGSAAPQQGVRSVACYRGAAMWDRLDREPNAKPLLDAALGLVPAHAKADVRAATARTPDAALFEVEYRDGLQAFVSMPNGWAYEGDGGAFVFAGQRKGEPKPDACLFYLQQPDPFAHFAYIVRAFDAMLRTGHAPYPVERTLLAGGILDAAMHSRFKFGQRIETPHLDVSYRPTEWPHATGPIPKPKE